MRDFDELQQDDDGTWFFTDGSGDVNGPFPTRNEAERALRDFLGAL